MMVQYFSHDVNAQFDDKCIRLIRELGYAGYGIFWALIERMMGSPKCELSFSLENLAWSLHTDEEILLKVVCNFGLFTISDDKSTFWSESARERASYVGLKKRTPSPQDNNETGERKRGRPRKNQLSIESSQAGEQSAPIEVSEPPTAEDPPTGVESAEQFYDEDCSQPNQGEEVIALWNDVFKGTKQRYKGLALDAISYQRLNEAYTSGFTIQDLEKAFNVARTDKFSWLLRDVLKAENIQRLLAKGEKQHEIQNNLVDRAASAWELPPDLQTDAWS